MKHKHYEMIAAKAANMNLTLFCYASGTGNWQELPARHLPDVNSHEYFLCLPKHKDACLHCLNGGKVEATRPDGEPIFSSAFVGSTNHSIVNWEVSAWYMNESCESRVKPKKEKRWIGVNEIGLTTEATETKETAQKSALRTGYAYANWQFIEIEVEV